MTTWVALLRGVNVGGHNKLPMKALVTNLATAGLSKVRSYIQSGNLVFESNANRDAVAALVRNTIAENNGFDPAVLILSRDELRAAVAANPFPKATLVPATLHLHFLSAPTPKAFAQKLDALCSPSESWALADRVLYLHAPEGIGRSRLAAGIDKALGGNTTARNWRTISRLIEMAD